jgi:hypothetical protein
MNQDPQLEEIPNNKPQATPPQLTHKHTIVPINAASVKKELAENPAPKPQPHPEAVTTPPVIPPQSPGIPVQPQQEKTKAFEDAQLARDFQGLRLYALVMLILNGLSLLYSVVYIQSLFTSLASPSLAKMVGLVTIVLPLLASIYLLVGKSRLIISALLIVIGLAFVTNVATLLTYAPGTIAYVLVNPVALLQFGLPIGMLVWTVAIFRRVQQV